VPSADIHRMTALLKPRLHFRQILAMPIPRHGALDIGAPSADNVDFVAIQTHLCFGFLSDAKQSSSSRRYGCRGRAQFRDLPPDAGKQISRMATSAIWNATSGEYGLRKQNAAVAIDLPQRG
jgi:hypothetical protein